MPSVAVSVAVWGPRAGIICRAGLFAEWMHHGTLTKISVVVVTMQSKRYSGGDDAIETMYIFVLCLFYDVAAGESC